MSSTRGEHAGRHYSIHPDQDVFSFDVDFVDTKWFVGGWIHGFARSRVERCKMQWADKTSVVKILVAKIGIGMRADTRDRGDVAIDVADRNSMAIDVHAVDGADGNIGQSGYGFELTHVLCRCVSDAVAPCG